MVIYPLHIFSDIANFYYILSLDFWPKKILHKPALEALYSRVFTELSEIWIRILNMNKLRMAVSTDRLLKSIFVDRLLEVDKWENYTHKMMKYYDTYSRFEMKQEIEPILDFIWNLSSPYREYLFGDNRMEEWNYSYRDGWKKLIELTR